MRTTIDLPDELYRSLKARAALNGVPVRQVIQDFVERGLRMGLPQLPKVRRGLPPVAIPPLGVPIPAMSPAELRRIEEAEDEEKHARSTRR